MNQMRNQSQNDPLKESKKVVSRLIRKNNLDVRKAFDEFTKGSNKRLSQGRAPNELYGGVVEVFSKLVPLEENLGKFKAAQTVTNNPIFNNLLYEGVGQMNELLLEDIFEMPETEGFSPLEEVRQYEQALIEIYNKLPEIGGGRRKDLLDVVGFMNEMIGGLKSNGGVS